jgi:hypothetical protein
MKVLKKIKEKIMATGDKYAFGYQDPNQTLQGQYAGGGLLGQAAQQGYNNAQQSQLAQLAQYEMQMAQQQAAMSNAFAQQATAKQAAISKTLSAFNLRADAVYTFEELNDEGSVYNMPLQTAVDLAITMFGSGWFKDDDTAKTLEENTDFLAKVMAKLFKAGRLKCETCRQPDALGSITAWKILDTDHGNS